jgi:hypothetical protein
MIVIITLLAFRRCRKKRKNAIASENDPSRPPQPVPIYPNQDPNAALRSPTWSGHKSELDAIGTATTTSPRYASGDFSSTKSEVEGSPALGGEGRPVKDGGWEMPGKLGTVYEAPA